jgi:hypothetical protein
MAYQGIVTGTSPNDNTGDSLLEGAIKINSNFQEIYSALGDGSNINFNQNTTITAGDGLTGGGDLTANRTFNVGAGTGIDVDADSISINSSYRFPSGTRMLFQQTSAPTGWTKDTTSVDNRALRVVSGTAGSGGTNSFTSVFASNRSVPLPQHNHGISDPGHGHDIKGYQLEDGSNRIPSLIIQDDDRQSSPSGSPADSGAIQSNTTGISINNEGTAGATMNFAVQYIDVIIAQRD